MSRLREEETGRQGDEDTRRRRAKEARKQGDEDRRI